MLKHFNLPIGDLKLVEKPQACILGPFDFTNIKVCSYTLSLCHYISLSTSQANIKVSSTENGIIFGNIGKLHHS